MGLIKKRQLFRDSTQKKNKKLNENFCTKRKTRKIEQQKFRTKTHTQLFKERQTQYEKKAKISSKNKGTYI